MTIDKWFEQFLQEKRYLENVSQHTIAFYKQSFKAFNLQEPLTQSQLNGRVIQLLEKGMSTNGCDAYIRGINSFLSWLNENELVKNLRVKRLKIRKRVFKTLTDQQLKAFLSFKPRTFFDHRLYTLLCLALDTGCRINELLNVKRSDVDFDNLFITVKGKGNKERIVPISVECRKTLFQFLKKHNLVYVFSSRHGSKLSYDNMRRDFNKLMTSLGIETDGAFHSLRRTFATNFAREGGSLFALQSILGHSSIQTTQKYVGLNIQDLALAHRKTSLLGRLRV